MWGLRSPTPQAEKIRQYIFFGNEQHLGNRVVLKYLHHQITEVFFLDQSIASCQKVCGVQVAAVSRV